MLNTVVLVGRLCTQPESKQTTSGTTICNFRVAVNRRGKADEADFFNVTCFEKTAQFVQQYVDKGALVGIEGRLQSRTYQTQGGESRYVVEVIANSVQALESKREAEQRRAQAGGTGGGNGGSGNGEGQARALPRADAQPAPTQQPQASTAIDEDDPFGDD